MNTLALKSNAFSATSCHPSNKGRSKGVHQHFEAKATTFPDAIAVCLNDKLLTYSRLNRSANQLAHHLIRRGIKHGSLVAVCMERSFDAIVALLGILKAGAAYVPLEPTFPDERFAFILHDTAAPLILSHQPTAARAAAAAKLTGAIELNTSHGSISAEPTFDPQLDVCEEDLAYVMYTSGSTGVPKGVLIEHRSIVRLVCETDYCVFGPDKVFLHHSPMAFDASTFEIWGPLLNGGQLALLPPGPPALDRLAEAIRRHGVTTLWLTAGLFNLMVDQRPDDLALLRQLVVGGEALSPHHVHAALGVLRDGVIINGYGPTESTTFACCFPMTKGYIPGDNIPIGQPIANTTAFVLDENLRPVPYGVPGELCIGGQGVARGYLNQPELTSERFVCLQLEEDVQRVYRTGDRVRMLPDGNLEFLGRFDDQVKILGHRIEPGEVEATLRKHSDVREAVVLARDTLSDGKQLVAYVVTVNSLSVSPRDLKRFLAEKLPSYMIPAHIVLLDRLPLNANGKVDRRALPGPDSQNAQQPKSCLHGSETEEEVAALWSRILHQRVGLDENFFDIGGSSLQLLEVHAELTRIYGREISITDVFEHATVRAMAARLKDGREFDSTLGGVQLRAQRQRHALARHKENRRFRA
jgi:aspartate racemase